MGSFKLGHMTLKSLISKPATTMYPAIAPVYFETTKGHIEIDIEACILCGLCEKKCPAVALKVDKPNRTWAIDPFACVQCGACVAVCPKQALTMANTYTAAATTKFTRTVTQAGKASEYPAD